MSCWYLPVPLDSEFHNIRNYIETDLLEKYFMLKLFVLLVYKSVFTFNRFTFYLHTHTKPCVNVLLYGNCVN